MKAIAYTRVPLCTVVALGICVFGVPKPCRAQAQVCVASGSSKVDCHGSQFNINVGSSDPASLRTIVEFVNSQQMTADEARRYFRAASVKLAALDRQLRTEQEVYSALRRLVAELDRQRENDALFTSDLARRFDSARHQLEQQERLVQNLRQAHELQGQAMAKRDSELNADAREIEKRVGRLEELQRATADDVSGLQQRSGLRYSMDRHRVALMADYATERPVSRAWENAQSSIITEVTLGYRFPGNWVLSPTVSIGTLRGRGTAIVTDPGPLAKILGQTNSWSANAFCVTPGLVLGRELGPLTPYVRGGLRILLSQSFHTVEFGEAQGKNAVSIPIRAGSQVRLAAGLVIRGEIGITYARYAQPARYEYQGPNAFAVLATADERIDLSAGLGVGYVVSL